MTRDHNTSRWDCLIEQYFGFRIKSKFFQEKDPISDDHHLKQTLKERLNSGDQV